MEIAQSYNSFYSAKPHIVSDSGAHARQSNGDTSVFYLPDKTSLLVASSEVDEVDLTEVQKHAPCVWLRSQRRFQCFPHVANTCEEEVAPHSPNQQSRKSNSLRTTLDITLGLGTWELAEHYLSPN